MSRSFPTPWPVLAARAGLVAAATLPAACGLGGPAHQPPPPGVPTVEMTSGLAFAPAVLTITAGDTVEWRNGSLFTHTVTADPADPRAAGDAALPAGAEPFDSGRVAAGEVFRHTFTVPGTYRYYCGPHHEDGMTGTIIVQPKA
jgi:plastocyanin